MVETTRIQPICYMTDQEMASCNILGVALNWTYIACFKLCSEIYIFHHNKIIFVINTAREQAIFLLIHFTNAVMNPEFAQHCLRLMGPNGETDHGPYPMYFTFFGGKGTIHKYWNQCIFSHCEKLHCIFMTQNSFHHLAGNPLKATVFNTGCTMDQCGKL